MRPLKDSPMGLRIPQALKERLEQMEEDTGIPPTVLAVEGLLAICNYYEENGTLTVPFVFTPKPKGKKHDATNKTAR